MTGTLDSVSAFTSGKAKIDENGVELGSEGELVNYTINKRF